MPRIPLDPAQQRIVDLPDDRSVLITGEAGVGKTQVALCRLARLVRRRRGLRAAVVVPGVELVGRTERRLRDLGVGVDVHTFDTWAHGAARHAFPDVPKRVSLGATPGVMGLKRHPGVRGLLELVDDALHPVERLFELWGDEGLLHDLALDVGLPLRWVAEVVRHAMVQFQPTALELHGACGRGLDGQSADLGTPDEDAGTLDVEDFPVLFAMAPGARPRPVDHLVVDEAQALAPMELAMLGRSLAPRGTMTLAGDAHQASDPTAWFAGWRAVVAELDLDAIHRAALSEGYRCPPDVMALARALWSGRPYAPTTDAVRLLLAPDDAARRHALSTHLATAPPSTVIARGPEEARRLTRELRGSSHTVTWVDQVRGLDLERVVLPDAGMGAYPAANGSREALYLAVTRARTSLHLYAADSWSPWLQPRRA